LQLEILSKHYLPFEDVTPETMGAALWLEKRQLELMQAATANGINKAFSGE
jgi:hypothetical protein